MKFETQSGSDDPLDIAGEGTAAPLPPFFAKVVCFVFLVLGLGILALATYLYMQQVEFMKTALRAPAQIVDFVEDTGDIGKNDTVYRPVLRFVANDQQTYTVTSTVGYSQGLQTLGQQVDVLYAPGKPQEADIDSFIGNWISIVLYGLGLVFFGFSLLGLFLMWRQTKAARG